MNKTWCIYILKMNDKVFYVGRSFNVKRRMQEHIRVFGKNFAHEIVEFGQDNNFDEAEKKWILHYLNLGVDLKNKTTGGNGSVWLSEQSRKLLSDKVKGRPCTWKNKISKTQTGVPKKWSENGLMRVKLTQFKKGNPTHNKGVPVPEHIKRTISEKVSKSLIGNKRRQGIKHTEETKNKIAESMKNSGNSTPELMGARAKSFWDNVTPEYKVDYINRRELARQASLQLKKIKTAI